MRTQSNGFIAFFMNIHSGKFNRKYKKLKRRRCILFIHKQKIIQHNKRNGYQVKNRTCLKSHHGRALMFRYLLHLPFVSIYFQEDRRVFQK